jgi:hypothetical protein
LGLGFIVVMGAGATAAATAAGACGVPVTVVTKFSTALVIVLAIESIFIK